MGAAAVVTLVVLVLVLVLVDGGSVYLSLSLYETAARPCLLSGMERGPFVPS